MPDEVTPERVAAIAAAARVPLEQAEAARAANATMTRFTAQRIALSLEVEPATIRLWPAQHADTDGSGGRNTRAQVVVR
jgi:hypothetical protein